MVHHERCLGRASDDRAGAAAGRGAGTGRGGQRRRLRRSYFRFLQADYNHPGYYPLTQRPDAARYRPAATWLGRLILPPPEQRAAVMGALFEVHLAGEGYAHLVGQTVWLRWTDDPLANARFWGVTQGVIFDKHAHADAAKGVVLPERVNNLPLVNPFESLAASLPADEVIVRLHEPVQVEAAGAPAGEGGRGRALGSRGGRAPGRAVHPPRAGADHGALLRPGAVPGPGFPAGG